MKTSLTSLTNLLATLIAWVGLGLAGRVAAQSFMTLHNFRGSDGAGPQAGLVLSGNTLYGTTAGGGSSSNGTVFAVNTNGTGFTNLHGFTTTSTNTDGAYPYAGLILSGATLYGTATIGTEYGNGTVFAVNTNGTGFTNLHNFTATSLPNGEGTNSDGAWPEAGLILSGNTLYGTAVRGGSSGNGTVFAVNTDGTGFTNLHSFTAGGTNSSGIHTNGDGALPLASLILSGNTLYGTAVQGGSSGVGTVFAVNTDGTGFTNLHNFTALSLPYSGTNGDGAYPRAALTLSGNTLYGSAAGGGGSGAGTLFSLSLPPPPLTIIRSVAGVVLTWPTPDAGLTLQCTTNLGPAAVWTSVSAAAVIVNGQNAVTNPISGERKFYRLSP